MFSKLIVFVLFGIFSTQAFSAYQPPLNNNTQLGGPKNTGGLNLPLPTLAGQMTLSAYVSSSAAGNFLSLAKWNGVSASQYQVTAGKTLRCWSFSASANGGYAISFGYGTAALAAYDAGTIPAGVNYYGGTATDASFLGDAVSNVYQSYPILVEFPASSFPFVKTYSNSINLSIIMSCIEQ